MSQPQRRRQTTSQLVTVRQIGKLIKQWDHLLDDLDRAARKVRSYRGLLSRQLQALVACRVCGYPLSAQEFRAGFREHDQCEKRGAL